jgi:hypothetical protein
VREDVRGLKLILTAESPEQRSSAVGYGIAPATKRLGPRRLRDYQVPWNQRPAQRVLLFEFTIEPGHSVPVLLVVLSKRRSKTSETARSCTAGPPSWLL